MWTNTCCSHPLHNPDELATGPIPFQGVKTAAIRRMDYELNLKNLVENDMNMVQKILYKANTDKTWAEYELDYILFAKKPSDQIVFEANENEISHTEFVDRENILDFLEAEVNTGRSKITPWFNMILQTKLFEWWDHLNKTGEIPAEDTSGAIIDYMRGSTKIDAEKMPSIVEYKRKVYSTGKASFSTKIHRPDASNSLETPDFDLEKLDRKEVKKRRAEERKLMQMEEFYSAQVKDPNDPCASQFGQIEEKLVQEPLSKLSQISPQTAGQVVTVRGRVDTIRAQGGS